VGIVSNEFGVSVGDVGVVPCDPDRREFADMVGQGLRTTETCVERIDLLDGEYAATLAASSSPSGHDRSTSVSEATRRGPCSLIQRATNSASFARKRR
jgi:hypothetical protein